MTEDQHRGLKRYERAKQLAALHAEPNLIGPFAWCRVRMWTDIPEACVPVEKLIPVYIVRLFAKDLVCVQAYGEIPPADIPAPTWLVRGGIEWAGYLRQVVRHYSEGKPVPEAFMAKRKIRPEIIRSMENLPDNALPLIFSKFREVGLLPALPTLQKATCPVSLPWDTLRLNFQDFLGTNSFMDSPPP